MQRTILKFSRHSATRVLYHTLFDFASVFLKFIYFFFKNLGFFDEIKEPTLPMRYRAPPPLAQGRLYFLLLSAILRRKKLKIFILQLTNYKFYGIIYQLNSFFGGHFI